MNFTAKVKNEIISETKLSPCCKLAALSAYLRTAGTVEIHNGKIGFSLLGEKDTNEFFEKIIKDVYGVTPTIHPEKQGERTRALYVSDKTALVLKELEILHISNAGIDVELGISEKLVKKTCCRRAYIKGSFLGSGSVTVPKITSDKATGYHMEFVFSKYVSAQDFCNILSDNGLIAKLIERKDSFVVYSKSSEEICDMLVMMGAKHAYLALQDIILQKMAKNNTNRIVNCEISNLNKQVEASCKSRTDISTVIDVIGLDNLSSALKEVALARIEYPEASLSQLAETLNITKSCLCHRLKKLSEMAESL